jgi:Flp pilus assembly protein TadG
MIPLLHYVAHRRRSAAEIGRAGAAAVEFALFLPVLLLMVLGLYEYSRWIGMEIELEQALRAGAQSAMIGQNYTDPTAIQAAVLGATDLLPAPAVYYTFPGGSTPQTGTPYFSCVCPDGTVNLCPGDPSYTSCTGGVPPGQFITIAAQTTYDPVILNLPGITANMPIWQELTFRLE